MINSIFAFLASVPELIKLFKRIEAQIKKREREAQAKDDVKKIREAFENEDAEALKDIFSK